MMLIDMCTLCIIEWPAEVACLMEIEQAAGGPTTQEGANRITYGYDKVTLIDLQKSEISVVPDAIWEVSSLTSLDLSSTGITSERTRSI
jgi:hypothetical protein